MCVCHIVPVQAYGPAAFTTGLTSGQRKQIAAWLTVCAGWVFALVCIGGATRLTRSGLSMTDWKFTGEQRPRTPVGWEQGLMALGIRLRNSLHNGEEMRAGTLISLMTLRRHLLRVRLHTQSACKRHTCERLAHQAHPAAG